MRRSLVVLFCMVGFLYGCGGMMSTGYLANYDQMTPGVAVDKVWYDVNKPITSTVLQVATIDTSAIKDEKSVTVDEVVKWLQNDMIGFSRTHGVTLLFDSSQDEEDYVLHIALTQMTPGSSAGRFWAAEFGAGHAQVQVEGKVVNKSGETVLTFTDFRRNTGALGLSDLGGDAGPALVRESTRKLAEDIITEVKAHMR